MPSSQSTPSHLRSASYCHDDPETLFEEALLLLQKGDFRKACELFDSLLLEHPENPAVLFYRSLAYMQRGRYDDALEGLVFVCQVHPHDADMLYQLGLCQQHCGFYEESVDSFKRVVSHKPDHWHAFFNLGVAFYSCGAMTEAIAAYKQAASIHPEDPDIFYNLGLSYKEIGEYDNSKAAYLKAVQLNPDDHDSHYNLGRLLKNMGVRDAARIALEKAVDLNPQSGAALTNLGALYVEEEMFDEAVEVYQTLIEMNHNRDSSQHIVNALTGKETSRAPLSYIQELYDDFAGHFEQRLLGDLCYTVPQALVNTLKDAGYGSKRFARLLDLGCGTGLCGEVVREFAEELTGVDLSREMLDAAAAKGIYDTLIQGDIHTFWGPASEQYDAIIAGDVFIYSGDLSGLIRSMTKSLRPDGVILFSAEDYSGGDFILRPSGRYAHSPSYIGRLAQENGLELLCRKTMHLRKEKSTYIQGSIFLFKNKRKYLSS